MWNFFGAGSSKPEEDAVSRRAAQIREEERRLRREREKLEKGPKNSKLFQYAVPTDHVSVQKNHPSEHRDRSDQAGHSQPQSKPEQKKPPIQPESKQKNKSGKASIFSKLQQRMGGGEKKVSQQTAKSFNPKPSAPKKSILRKSTSAIGGENYAYPPHAPTIHFSDGENREDKSQARAKGQMILSRKVEVAKQSAISLRSKASVVQRIAGMIRGSSAAGPEYENELKRSGIQGLAAPPVYSGGDYWRTSQFTKIANDHFGPTPQVSGFISVQEYANNVIDDPLEIETWVQSMTTKFYLFWIFLVLCASFMNAVLIFVFRFMDEVYARDTLYEILLWNSWNVYGVVGNMLSFLAAATWGCWMLTTPAVKSNFLTKFRWIMMVVILIYVAYSIVNQFVCCISLDLEGGIEMKMVHDLKTRKNRTTRLEDHSQKYFQCCGIRSLTDWDTYGHTNRSNRIDLRGGYPTSCCRTEFPECPFTKPVTKYSDKTQDKDVIQLWTYSCLTAEYYMVVSVMVVLGFIQIMCLITTIGACMLMRHVIRHTNEFSLTLGHPFV